ncbi:unnamed protein product [Arabis nemorensis]|uniref:F-box domain-containing protein n=1 Tax=Arabis nemorensis TaxID=586526 RepID=A0A565CHN6_9BRAS|nr:unnamed protein product [Arabis nemorensis]
MVTTEETRKSSESPAPTSFSSLPYDVTLNILARITRLHRRTLSLVSKNFGSLVASRELHVTRTLIGKTENYMYVCLKTRKNSEPRWFMLASTPNQQKLIPIPPFPYEYPESPTIVSVDSEIYLIGGFLKDERRRKVFLLDCQSHQWHTLPEMRIPRGKSAAEVINSKIYVIGGCKSDKIENWGEVYDLKTQTWEQLSSSTTMHLPTQKSTVPGGLVIGGKLYGMDGLKFNFLKDICLVEIESNVFCQISVYNGKVTWCDANKDVWRNVTGLEGLYIPNRFVSVANLCGGRRVTVWWKKEKFLSVGWETEIWCAEVSFERHGVEELQGVVEWSKSVFTFDGCDFCFDFFLNYAILNLAFI